MAVHKYKPKASPRMMERRVEAAASTTEKTVEDSRKAIARSRQLLEEAHQAVEAIRRRKRA